MIWESMKEDIDTYKEPTYAEEIEEAAGGARNIEAIVIGPFGWDWDEDGSEWGHRTYGLTFPRGKPENPAEPGVKKNALVAGASLS